MKISPRLSPPPGPGFVPTRFPGGLRGAGKVLAALVTGMLAVSSPLPAQQAAPEPEAGAHPVVGIVGHSLVNHVMPRMLRVICADAGTKFTVYEQVINGAPLSHQWKNHDKAEKSGDGLHGDLYEEITKASPGFNHVILTERVAIHECIEWEDTLGNVINWRNHALSHEPGCQVYFLSTWVGFKEGEWWLDIPDDATWRKRTLADGGLFEKVAREASEDPRSMKGPAIRVIPGHKAVVLLHDELLAGKLPWLGKDIHAIFADNIHMNEVGNYFIACLIHAAVTNATPEGVTGVTKGQYGEPLTSLEPEQAKMLQGIVWRALRE